MIGLFCRNAPSNAFDPFFQRNHAIEGNDQQPALHATIHAALERWKRVGGENMLRDRSEFDSAFIHVAPLDRLAGDDGFERFGGDGSG